MKNIVYLSGLPRSGSTLLANVLAMHPAISSTPSSPLCSIVQSMRKQWSDDPFLLSQLDDSFDTVHDRLKRAMFAFMQEWSSEHSTPIVIDKNRGWLNCLEWLRELDPNFKIIVTLRDLRDVYTSVEKRHRKSLFIDFPDHMEHNFVDARANHLFNDGGIVGTVLKGIQNVADIPNIISHIYYWRYEDFIGRPRDTMNSLFSFIGVEPIEIDFNNITQSTHESDSYYRMKYSHKINTKIEKPLDHNDALISPRILKEIENRFSWYYSQFYSDSVLINQNGQIAKGVSDKSLSQINPDEEVMIKEIEKNIRKETK